MGKKITICVPTKNQINVGCASFLLAATRNLEDITGYQVKTAFYQSSYLDWNRSIALTDWYDGASDNDLFLFIDSDQTLTVYDICRLIEEDADVVCGIYPSRGHKNTAIAANGTCPMSTEPVELLYAATGIMLIRKPIVEKMYEYLENELSCEPRIYVGMNYSGYTVPFFRNRFVIGEVPPYPKNRKSWLGEDYSFCWLARNSGGKIKGILTNTIGHEVTNEVNFTPKKFKDENTTVNFLAPGVKSLSTIRLTQESLTVVYISQNLNLEKMNVNVFMLVDNNKAFYRNMMIYDVSKFESDKQYDNLVLCNRKALNYLGRIASKNVIVDINYNLLDEEMKLLESNIDKIKCVVVKSEYQKSLMSKKLKDKLLVIENGIEYNDRKNLNKKRNSVLLMSWNAEGLERILKENYENWKKMMPEIEIHACCFGEFAGDWNIQIHSDISMAELVEIVKQCAFYYCINDKNEVDCYFAKIAAYNNCIPIVPNNGVFKGIEYTVKVDMSIDIHKKASNILINLMQNEKEHEECTEKIRKRGQKIKSWKKIVSDWIFLFN